MAELDLRRLACELADPWLRPVPPRRWYRLMARVSRAGRDALGAGLQRLDIRAAEQQAAGAL